MEHLQPNDSLRIIQDIINQRKQKYEENGFFLIFWGILISISGMVHFAMLKLNFYPEKSGLVWAILMPLGFIFTFIAKFRKGKKAHQQDKTTDWLDWIWFIAGLGALLNGFTQPTQWIIILIYLPFAMAALATALQLKNRLWIFAAILSFVLIYSSLFINYNIYITLMSSVLGILLFLIPGVDLHSDYKKRNNNHI